GARIASFCARTVEQNNPFTVSDHKAVISRFRRRAAHFFDCHAPRMVAVDCDGPEDEYPGGEELLDIGGETRVGTFDAVRREDRGCVELGLDQLDQRTGLVVGRSIW